MKRFAIAYNQIPQDRLIQIPFLRDECDWIGLNLFEVDPNVLDEYEAIFLYLTSGAHPEWYPPKSFQLIPKIMREEMKITKPKFIYQLDYFGEHFNNDVLPYIDAITDLHDRTNWGLSKPVFYVAFPITVPQIEWKDYNEKKDAVGLKRFYGSPYPSMKFAEDLHIGFDCLGISSELRYGTEYMNFLAEHKLGLDFHTNGTTWSRFGAECVFAGTPVLGDETMKSIQIANPDFVGKPDNLLNMGRRLLQDNDFYEEVVNIGYENIKKHLDPDVCSERYKYALRQLGIDV